MSQLIISPVTLVTSLLYSKGNAKIIVEDNQLLALGLTIIMCHMTHSMLQITEQTIYGDVLANLFESRKP